MQKKTLFAVITSVIIILGAVIIIFFFKNGNNGLSPGNDPDNLYDTTAASSTFPSPGVDTGNAQDIISMIKAPETLYWEVSTTLYGENGHLSHTGRYWQSGSDRRIDVLTDGELQKTVLVTQTGVTVKNQLTNDSYTVPYGPQYTAEAVMGMADVGLFLSTPPENIRAAELRDFNGQSAVYVELYYPDVEQTDMYYISLDFGLPLRVQSYFSGTLVYEADTLQLSGQLPDQDVFS